MEFGYKEGALRLIVEATDDGWMIYTQQCTDGMWEDDEALGDIEADSLDQARNAAITAALLAGYAPNELHWWAGRFGEHGQRVSMIPLVEDPDPQVSACPRCGVEQIHMPDGNLCRELQQP